MKTYLILLVALLGFVGPACAQTSSLPKIISDGFAAYTGGGGPAKAVDVWFTGSPLANNPANKTNYVTFLTTFETNNGKFSGYENMGVVTLSPSVKYYYVVILYEN